MLPYVKQTTGASSVHEAGHSEPMLGDNPDGDGMGWGGGREAQDGGTNVHLWLIHVHIWQNPPQYCEVIRLHLNKFIFFLKLA